MTDVQFGRLEDLPLRDAWKHEAHSFTPWLAENIDHIAEAIGLQLELTGQEVRVEKFAADILARSIQDDTLVLIENQLEEGDHNHLGQIMTYLAGLEAHTVVWIAPSFREPHLAAIRWLNQHTADGFSFFAVRLRVVRISDSPFAPVFEVVEKPNNWTRALNRQAESAQAAASTWHAAFWKLYLDRHPDAAELGIGPSRASSQSFEVIPAKLQIGRAVWKGGASVYLRGPWRQDVAKVSQFLAPYRERIEQELGAKFFDGGGWHALVSTSMPMEQEASWPTAADFLHQQTRRYLQFVSDIMSEGKVTCPNEVVRFQP